MYGILPLGSLRLIYLFAAVYLLAVMGLGLLISTYANTQQQAMLIAFFLNDDIYFIGGIIHSYRKYALLGAGSNAL